MKLARITAALAVAVATGAAALPAAAEITVPSLVYRTGPYAPNGIPWANAFQDYFNLLNERDGGINGVKVKVVECETAYNTTQGVECYESTKAEGLVFHPRSTGITYQLIPKATTDHKVIHSMMYGRTSAANGKVFPNVFNFPANYWDAASIMLKHAGDMEGGMDGLKGKTIALVYHNSAYGKEPIRTLEKLSEKHGFALELLPVDHPGQEQKATWLKVRQMRPDFVFMWGWGVMNQVAIQEAASVRFPMDRFIGTWWSGSENDVLPAGAAANGYKSITVHAPGASFKVHEDILSLLYDNGKGAGERDRVGEVVYNRGMLEAMYTAEAYRTAMEMHKTDNPTGDQLRDGFEALNLDQARLAAIGMEGFTVPVQVSCENHGGPGLGAIQQWNADSKTWTLITDFVGADREIIDPLIAEDSAAYASENNVEERACN
ncbi:MAG: ABC transporter substrate-binding protein [Neomegalonema sp.]|nr:ABC transporter substrate-binding protein [Neomegalonema sp.]